MIGTTNTASSPLKAADISRVLEKAWEDRPLFGAPAWGDNLHPMQTLQPNDLDLPPLNASPPGLYQHYKGGWYEVLDTVRCSETLTGMTLYRALYGGFGLWVRPAPMFAEIGAFQGKTQPRFVRHDILSVVLADLPTAQALVAHLMGLAQRRGVALDTVLRPAPTAPSTGCGRGCNGGVWEDYFAALRQWREEACDWLSKFPERPAH